MKAILQVTLIRKSKNKTISRTLRSLGLTKLHQRSMIVDNIIVRGQLRKVQDYVDLQEVL